MGSKTAKSQYVTQTRQCRRRAQGIYLSILGRARTTTRRQDYFDLITEQIRKTDALWDKREHREVCV